jgi:hypothetical protein
MASGILGQSALAADTNTTVYTVPASTLATVNINLCNRGPDPAVVRIALAASGTPGNAEFIEFGVTIPAGGVLERLGFVVNAGRNVVARASTANCSVTVHGFERAA